MEKPTTYTLTEVVTDENNIKSIIVDNKDGRGAITAKFFVDASGDGVS